MAIKEKTGGRPMPSNRVASQAHACAQIIVETLAASLLPRHPADRCLREILQQNHQLGARDRRIINETLFSVLRWWGWLQKLAPANFVSAWKKHASEAPIHSSDWSGVLSAAWLLENRFELPPSVMFWLREAGLYPELFANLPADTPVRDRRKYLRPFFQDKPMPPLLVEELLQEWSADLLDLPEDADFAKLLEWMQKRPPVWLRFITRAPEQLRNEIQNESEGAVRPIAHPLLKNAFEVRHASANLRALSSFRDGQFEMQDLASQAVAWSCAPKAGEQWWDCCAGGGGKSLHLAVLMDNRGSILATDLRENKLEELKLRARRNHLNNIRTRVWNGKSGAEYKERFDGVLVDTPCSCSGTWRRSPDGRWNSTRESIDEFAALQGQILEAASAGVKIGGKLVYSTCSMFRLENQCVVEKFLAAHPDFILLPHVDPLTGKSVGGMRQIWPWEGDCDAMFTAVMVRRQENPVKG